MDAYTAAPGEYTIRMTIGDTVQEQPFRLRVDPRLGGDTPENLQAYVEMDALSEALMGAADAMSKGVSDLRLVQKQLDLLEDLGAPEAVTARGAELDARIDAWIALILQEELKTFQHVYQHEGRLLLKIKDLLDRMHGSDLPLTQGFRDVTRDYHAEWEGYAARLTSLRDEDIAAFNAQATAAGFPALVVP
jgi:hypothetical protein